MLFLAQDRQESMAAMIEDLPQAKKANDDPEVPKPGEQSINQLGKRIKNRQEIEIKRMVK